MPIMDYKIPDRYAKNAVNVAYHSRNPRMFVKNNVHSVPPEREDCRARQFLRLFLNLFPFNNRVVPAW
jgi:hypothetical protein